MCLLSFALEFGLSHDFSEGKGKVFVARAFGGINKSRRAKKEARTQIDSAF